MRTKQNQTNEKTAALPGTTACLWKKQTIKALGEMEYSGPTNSEQVSRSEI